MPETLLVESHDARLEVDVYGSEGHLVCLLPGLGGGIRRFRPLAERLASEGFRPVAVNPRGAGTSEGRLDGLTLHDYADDVACVIRAFGDGAALVGAAFGNRLARCVAANFPDLVAALVLVCAGGRIPPQTAALAAMMRIFDESLSDADRVAAAREALFAPGNQVPPDFLADSRSALAAESQTAALQRTDTDEWWLGGDAPILVVQGAQDRIAPPANGHQLRAELGTRVEVIDIDGAGHAVLYERPAEVADAVTNFLRPLALDDRSLDDRSGSRARERTVWHIGDTCWFHQRGAFGEHPCRVRATPAVIEWR